MNFEEVSILELIKHLDPQADGRSVACSHYQDDGGYELSHIWDPLLRKAPTTPGLPSGVPLPPVFLTPTTLAGGCSFQLIP